MTTFCQLPHEILAYILKLSQNRTPYNGDGLMNLFSYDHGTRLDELSREWRHTMLACTLIRQTALHSPELWSVIDTSWPERWMALCIQRACDHPLDLTAVVHDKASLALVEQLGPTARHAAVVLKRPFGSESTASAWCKKLIKTGTMLRSIQVAGSSAYMRAKVPLEFDASILPSSITYLTIERYVCLTGIPNLPHLQHLLLAGRVLRLDLEQVHRWLLAAPQVTSLVMRHLRPEPQGLPPRPGPLLPHLAHLSLNGKCSNINPFMAILPVPRHSLILTVRCSDPAQLAALEGIFAFVSAFWSPTAERSSGLPPATLDLSDTRGKLEMRGAGARELHIQIRLSTRRSTAALGPFLRTVTKCHADVSTLNNVDWADVKKLTALHTLHVMAEHAQYSDTGPLQAWADERAQGGLGPVQVRIKVPGPFRERTRRWWMCAEWNTGEEQLTKARWTDPSSAFLNDDDVEVNG
jgi:hypothetical protein